MSTNAWFVSRQHYWGMEPDEARCVEIAAGGRDYANADMLCPVYPGEAQEYQNPDEAVSAALGIAELWRKDCPEPIRIDHGATGGMSIPFDGDKTEEELREWARNIIAQMPHCDGCGEIMFGSDRYTHDYADDLLFCSNYCAEKNYFEFCQDDDAENDD